MLMLACSIGTPEMVKLLVDSYANVNVKDRIGRTALHYACRRGSVEHAMVLLILDVI